MCLRASPVFVGELTSLILRLEEEGTRTIVILATLFTTWGRIDARYAYQPPLSIVRGTAVGQPFLAVLQRALPTTHYPPLALMTTRCSPKWSIIPAPDSPAGCEGGLCEQAVRNV